jgi:hypothetical protein
MALEGGSLTAKLLVVDLELEADEEKNRSMLTIFLRNPH